VQFEQNADINMRDKEGYSALNYCIDIIKLPKFQPQQPVIENQPNNSQIDPSLNINNINNNNNNITNNTTSVLELNGADKISKFETLTLRMIERGADVNTFGKFTRNTVLHYAACAGNLQLCKKLVEEYGAQILTINVDRCTPIFFAEKMQHHEIVDYLTQQLPRPKTCLIL